MGTYRQLESFSRIALAMTVILAMTACTTGGGSSLDSLMGEGKYAPDFIKANIVPKQSTKAQIRERFGVPSSVRDNLGNNTSEWTYRREDSRFSKLKGVTYKYLPEEYRVKMLQTELQTGDALGAVRDVDTVVGNNAPGDKTKVTILHIRFKGEVVEGFTTF